MLALLPAERAGGADRGAGHHRPGHHRRGGLRPQEARGGLQPPGPAGRPPARGQLGRDRDRAGRGPGGGIDDPRATAAGAAAPGAGCAAAAGPGRAGSGCAPTPATSPGSWPAPPTTRRDRVRHRRQADRPAVAAAGRHRRRPTGPTRSTCTMRRSPCRRLLPGLVAGRHPAADPPGADWPRSRSPPIRGRGGAAPCTPTSGPCRSPSSPHADAIYGYSFIVTNLDVSTPEQGGRGRALVPAPHQRSRTSSATAKHGAALRHLPSGYPQVNTGLDVGCAARRQHRRLAAPAHRSPRADRHRWPDTASATARP